jgi:SAM-dependent methyltransferase
MLKDNCRLCGHHELKVALELSNVPRNIQRLFGDDELHLDSAIDLSVWSCSRCGFVQIKPMLDDAYYDDYLMTTSHSKQMQQYQRRQSSEFVERFNLNGRRVHEMGCGDGSYLEHLNIAGAIATGIEPSNRFRSLAQARGFKIDSGYVTADRELPGGPFDGFVTRQVLEHVPNIEDFLRGIWRNLKPGAAGLVEVPSLEKAMLDHRYYDFFPDHVNYFSLQTLRLALELNGFEVLETRHDMYNEYNVAIVRRSESPNLSNLQITAHELGNELREILIQLKSKKQLVAIWGAGGKGLSIMAEAGIHEIDLLVDGDPHKQGLYTPVSHLKVEAPSALLQHNISTVIITAMAYRNEIERALRDDFRFKGKVYVLGHKLEESSTWVVN